jgi:Kef-type K+ transport system membrane component KefB
MVFAEAREHFALEHQALPVYQFLVPFFFVITGSQVDWHLFVSPDLMALALGVSALALLGKILGGGLGVLGMRRRSMAIVGVGMAPRGEVGLIVASLGLSLGAIGTNIFSVVVIMSILTTLVVPPVLRLLYAHDPETAISAEDRASQAGCLPDLGAGAAHAESPLEVA